MTRLDLTPTEAMAIYECITAIVQSGLAKNPDATLDALAVRARLKSSKDVRDILAQREKKEKTP